MGLGQVVVIPVSPKPGSDFTGYDFFAYGFIIIVTVLHANTLD